MFSNLWGRLQTWASSPFSSSMSAWGWFLFLGLLLLIFASWAEIFGYVKKEA